MQRLNARQDATVQFDEAFKRPRAQPRGARVCYAPRRDARDMRRRTIFTMCAALRDDPGGADSGAQRAQNARYATMPRAISSCRRAAARGAFCHKRLRRACAKMATLRECQSQRQL